MQNTTDFIDAMIPQMQQMARGYEQFGIAAIDAGVQLGVFVNTVRRSIALRLRAVPIDHRHAYWHARRLGMAPVDAAANVRLFKH